MALELRVDIEGWAIAGTFRIAREARTVAEVVVVELSDGTHRGRGEAVPYSRYGETPDSVAEAVRGLELDGLDLLTLPAQLPHGAARNAVDCALWDLSAKQHGSRVWEMLELPMSATLTTAYTLVLDTPEAMAAAAATHAERPLLKLKLGGDARDLARIEAVRAAAPRARLVVDANEAWDIATYRTMAPKLAHFGIEMIEQPLPAAADEALRGVDRPVPLCADESCHDRSDLDRLEGLYDMVNIKLDKTGGLSEALALAEEADQRGFQRMVGCMVGTSLAMAPARLVAEGAAVVDLDGPLLLARDRAHGLSYAGSQVGLPEPELWG